MEQKTMKEVIIQTTKELLIKNGNATIKDISEAAHVNVAAINYHFGSKDNLITIVIEEVILELRTEIVGAIKEKNIEAYNFEEVFMIMMEIIFSFAEHNTGLISFSFLQMAMKSDSKNIIIDTFINDKEFVSIVTNNMRNIHPDASDETLFSKYLIMFSAFVVPFFLSFGSEYENMKADFLNRMKHEYLNELKKILYA